jgi:hypothetical protein
VALTNASSRATGDAFRRGLDYVYSTGHAKHARRRVDSAFHPLEIEMNEWTVGEHASKLPRLFPESIQFLLARCFLFREVAGEQLYSRTVLSFTYTIGVIGAGPG